MAFFGHEKLGFRCETEILEMSDDRGGAEHF
jgi:hypothetical protein